MKSISKSLNIISILVFIIAFFTKGYNINRLILLILGIIISLIGLISDRKRRISIIALYALTLIIGLFFLDVGFVYFMKFKPIFAISVKSSNHFKTYIVFYIDNLNVIIKYIQMCFIKKAIIVKVIY